jgi:hypothetical protein
VQMFPRRPQKQKQLHRCFRGDLRNRNNCTVVSEETLETETTAQPTPPTTPEEELRVGSSGEEELRVGSRKGTTAVPLCESPSSELNGLAVQCVNRSRLFDRRRVRGAGGGSTDVQRQRQRQKHRRRQRQRQR